ncbi:hypothetical protein D9M72_435720 [compost metagenome]
MVGQQSAHGVDVVVGKAGAEGLVELGDLGQAVHAPAAVGHRQDIVLVFVQVELILDIADDLLEHVLDRHQPGHAAVLVDDDGDMVAVDAEFAQQDIQALGFGDEHRRAQRFAQVEGGIGVVAQQVLGQQDADDVVTAAFIDREARVRGLLHERDEGLRRVDDIDHIHLRARHHDVAGGQFGDLEHALDHRQRIGVDQVALMRLLEHFKQFCAGVRLGGDQV